ncbi:TPA: hypothetical protein NGR52_004247 [Vibrio parahaemolyticus]|nr:hypothetical protein [Vibrio parahaemolyticus]
MDKPTFQIDLTLHNAGEAQLSYWQQSKLVMLHAECISAQWGLNDFVPTIQVCSKSHFQLGLDTHLSHRHPNVYTPNYQSFFFDIADFEKVVDFFALLRFPMERCVLLDKEQYDALSAASKH